MMYLIFDYVERKLTIRNNKEEEEIKVDDSVFHNSKIDPRKALLFLEIILHECYPKSFEEKNVKFLGWYDIDRQVGEKKKSGKYYEFSDYSATWNRFFKRKGIPLPEIHRDTSKKRNEVDIRGESQPCGLCIEKDDMLQDLEVSVIHKEIVILYEKRNEKREYKFNRNEALASLGFGNIPESWRRKGNDTEKVTVEHESIKLQWLSNQVKRSVNGPTIDKELLPFVKGTKQLFSYFLWETGRVNALTNNVTILYAPNGYGKTYSMLYGARKGVELSKESERKIARIIYAKATDIVSEKGLLQYLFNRYILETEIDQNSGISLHKAMKQLFSEDGAKSTIIFIDGFDEPSEQASNDNIISDIKTLNKEHVSNIRYVISTRNGFSLEKKLDCIGNIKKVSLDNLDIKNVEIDNRYKEIVKRNNLFATPLFIALFKQIQEMESAVQYDDRIDRYGNAGTTNNYDNEAQIFDAWYNLLISHTPDKAYLYRYVLPYLAYKNLNSNRINEDGNRMTKDYFEDSILEEWISSGVLKDEQNDYSSLLWKECLNTGLIETSDHISYGFTNERYMSYFAAIFILAKINNEKFVENKEKMLNAIVADIEYGDNVEYGYNEEKGSFYKTLSFAYFVLKKLSNDFYYRKEETQYALFSLCLNLGRYNNYDVFDEINYMFPWFFDKERNGFDTTIIEKVNAVLYNSITKWNLHPGNEKVVLDRLLKYYFILREKIERMLEKNDQSINEKVYLKSLYAVIISNIGAVNQGYARYYNEHRIDIDNALKEISDHLNESERYHIEALKYRKEMFPEYFQEEISEIIKQSEEKSKNGAIRTCITIATDSFYKGLYLTDLGKKKRKILFKRSIEGFKYKDGTTIPGYLQALELLGSFDDVTYSDLGYWNQIDHSNREDCEPFVIFRRIAGCYLEMWKIDNNDKYLNMSTQCLNKAADSLNIKCVANDGNVQKEQIYKFSKEINDFMADISNKYLWFIKEGWKQKKASLEIYLGVLSTDNLRKYGKNNGIEFDRDGLIELADYKKNTGEKDYDKVEIKEISGRKRISNLKVEERKVLRKEYYLDLLYEKLNYNNDDYGMDEYEWDDIINRLLSIIETISVLYNELNGISYCIEDYLIKDLKIIKN